jgi:cytochrome c556
MARFRVFFRLIAAAITIVFLCVVTSATAAEDNELARIKALKEEITKLRNLGAMRTQFR